MADRARLTATRPPWDGLADPPVAAKAMFAAYILFSEKLKKRYAGSAKDPFRRLEQHNQGKSAFTSRGMPWALKYGQFYETRSEAAARERFLKSGAGRVFLDRLFDGEMGYPEKEIPSNCLRFGLM
ncbi:MAG: GIY-YIG nuclease family protein [Kiritimatiellia bacterium]